MGRDEACLVSTSVLGFQVSCKRDRFIFSDLNSDFVALMPACAGEAPATSFRQGLVIAPDDLVSLPAGRPFPNRPGLGFILLRWVYDS